MAKPTKNLIAFMGWNVQGDFGPWTMYTTQRGEVVFYDKAPPLSPASLLQKIQRDKFRSAAIIWKTWTIERRKSWEEASIKANLRITGYNLFIFWMTVADLATIQTVERNSGITLVS